MEGDHVVHDLVGVRVAADDVDGLAACGDRTPLYLICLLTSAMGVLREEAGQTRTLVGVNRKLAWIERASPNMNQYLAIELGFSMFSKGKSCS